MKKQKKRGGHPSTGRVWKRGPNDMLGRYTNHPKVSHVFRITNIVNGRIYIGLETNRNAMWCRPSTTYSLSHLQYGSDIIDCKAFKHDLDTMGRQVFVVDNLFSSPDRKEAKNFLKQIRTAPGFYGPRVYNGIDDNFSPEVMVARFEKYRQENNFLPIHDMFGMVRGARYCPKTEPKEVTEAKLAIIRERIALEYNKPELEPLVRRQFRERYKRCKK